MKIVIVFCIVITTAYLIYYFRYHLRYFFSLIFYTNKNKNAIEKLKRQGLNKRKVSNEDLNNYIKTVKEKLAEKSYFKFNEFVVDEELERHLKYSRFSEKYLEELFCKILEHLKLKREDLDFEIEYMSSKRSYGYVGAYFEKKENPKAKVYICVKNDMTYETVISVLAHECCHHLLISNEIRLDERIKNECLTDVTTALTGFGKYMVKGYEISNRVIYAEEFLRLVDKDRVGYLSSKDIKYAIKKLKK